MLIKLRNKLLVFNMCLTSLVIIAAFAFIYFFTYSNIQAEIREILNARQETKLTLEVTDGRRDSVVPGHREGKGGATFAQQVSASGPASFTIEVNKDGEPIAVESFLDLPKHVYDQAAKTAWSNKNGDDAIALADRKWRYSINQASTDIISGDGQAYTVMEDQYRIMYLDVTEYNRRLFELRMTLASVGCIMLIAFFFTSLFFSNRAIKPIAKTWEAQKRFVADASHELKTPISIINANYDALMANQDQTIRSQLRWLDYIRIGTDRMTKLTADLLTLAKMEDVHVKLNPSRFDLSQVVRETAQLLDRNMKEKGIALSRSIEPGITIESDRERVKQVILILLDNAVKYTNQNGRIAITLKHSKRSVLLSVENSGKGIAEEDLAKVFDRFYRADLSRSQEESAGYGLGLSIARTITDRLGGTLQVTSIENQTTTFTFSLDVKKLILDPRTGKERSEAMDSP